MNYRECAEHFHRPGVAPRQWRPWLKSKNQWIGYDAAKDCYLHKHHDTVTVEAYKGHYVVNTHGWDTVTTWEKITKFCGVRTTSHGPSKLCAASRFVYWSSYGGWKYAEYYDGIHIHLNGVPVSPQPVRYLRLKPGATQEFDALVKKCRTLWKQPSLVTRMAIGEFDADMGRDSPDGEECYDLLSELARLPEGEIYAPHDLMAPLLLRRQAHSFGRVIRSSWRRTEEKPMPSPQDRLNACVTAARRYYMERFKSDMYDTYTKEQS
jgi:hypothetical protein